MNESKPVEDNTKLLQVNTSIKNKITLKDDVIQTDENKSNNNKDNLIWKDPEVNKSFMDRYHRLFECVIC